MSDEEDPFMSESDDGDFSASEDEWLPESQKDKKQSKVQDTTMETDSDLSDDEEEEESDLDGNDSDSATPKKMTRKQAAKRGKSMQNRSNNKTSHGVKKLFGKYKPAPVQSASSSSSTTSTSLNDILKRSEFQSKKFNLSQNESQQHHKKPLQEDDESSSSGDEHLVPADQINLNSDFFNIQPNVLTSKKDDEPPDFDCNTGLTRSDSESEHEFNGFGNDSINRESTQISEKTKKSRVVSKINKNSSKIVDLQELSKFNQELESAKEHLKGLHNKSFEQDDVNVSQLLAMGEETKPQSNKSNNNKQKHKRKHDESGSDWEEVEDDSDSNNDVKTKDLQITVELPGTMAKRSNKEVDIQAQIKRKINNMKKIRQVYMHKVHLLAWIAYGNRVNRALNSPELYKASLKTLPTPAKQCYPKDKTDIKYYQQISTWYRQQYSLKSQSVYPVLNKMPPLMTSLALQISSKQMICKRDYCLGFIVLLRAMGFQCRLVMSLVGVPLKPPAHELCSLSKIDKSKMFKSYKKNEENVSESEKTTLDELKKGRKAPVIKEDPKVPKKRKRNSKSTDDNQGNEESKGKRTKKRKKSDEDDAEPKVDQLDGANDTPPRTRKATRQKSMEQKQNSNSKTDSPFKKSRGNSSSDVKSLENFAPPVKPKIKRLSEVPLLNNSVDPSPLKTRTQRLKEGSKPKMPQTLTKVTKNLTTTLSDTQNLNKSSGSILKQTNSSPAKLQSTRKSVTFQDSSPKPSTSKDPSPRASKKGGPRGHQNKKQKIVIPKSDDEDLFEPSIKLPKKQQPLNKRHEIVKRIDRRVLSSDDETPSKSDNKKNSINVWIEVYAEKEKRWITVDLFKGKVDCVDDICRTATSPITYVVAWNNDNTIKDVSPRYCEHWNTTTRKLRVEKEWWDETIKPYLGKVTERDKAENKYFDKIHSAKPMPTAISDFKNHPLYALERHLLKFEALYPPDAAPIGWIRKEPVYPRDCVYTLLTREKWVKEARVVKLNEEPYKIVTSPKWDRFTQKILKNCPVELFGIWQTSPYEPPTAENGIVPRNEYGNVELFKECMLPKKTVHIQLAGLNKVCKKLGIDCAPAIVGFDFHNGWSHPVYDGFVVCEEFKDTVLDAWNEEQDELERKEREKIEKRVYANWRKLIKGLLIRKRLQARYNFEEDDDENEEEANEDEPLDQRDKVGKSKNNQGKRKK